MINTIKVKGLWMRVDKDVYEEIRQETGYSGERLLKELERIYEGVLEREVDICAEHHLKTVKKAMWKFIGKYRRWPKTITIIPFGTADTQYTQWYVTSALDEKTRNYLRNDKKYELDYLFYGE